MQKNRNNEELHGVIQAKVRFINIFSLLTALVFFLFSLIYLFVKHNYLIGGIELALALLTLVNLGLLQKSFNTRRAGAVLLIIVMTMSLIIFVKGGIGNSGNLWILTIPVMALFLCGKRMGLRWILGYALLLGLLITLSNYGLPALKFSDVTLWQTALVFLAITLLIYYYEHTRAGAEALIYSQESELRTIMENMNDVSYRTDLQGNIIKISKASETITGYPVEEIIGTRLADHYVNPEDRERFVTELQQNGGVIKNFEAPLRAKDGRIVWLMTNATFYKDKEGNIAGVQGVTRDVTEKKRFELELQRQKDENDAILKTIPDILFLFSREGVFLDVRQGKHVKLLMPKEAFIGKRAAEVLSPELAELTRQNIQKSLMTKEVVTYEYSLVFDGNTEHFESRMIAIDDEKIIALIRDITQKKENEQKLQNLNVRLEELAREEKQKREHQEKILVQQSKLATMGEMIAAITHQWRQPLSSLSLLLQDTKEAYEHHELTEEYLAGNTDKALGHIRFMSDTIDDFKDFFKPSKTKELFDTRRAVADIYAIVSGQMRSRSIRVEIEEQGAEDLRINGYKNEFKQVILNLLNNAADAIEQRYEKKELAIGDGVIHIRFTSCGQNCFRISVEDNGGGIPETLKERIFEPYFTTKEESKGTGIGLYMSKAIIEESMNGRLECESSAEGTRFLIALKKR